MSKSTILVKHDYLEIDSTKNSISILMLILLAFMHLWSLVTRCSNDPKGAQQIKYAVITVNTMRVTFLCEHCFNSDRCL